jgi:hypothetical protein
LRARCREYAIARFDWDEVTRLWEEQLVEAAMTGRPWDIETTGAEPS